MKPQKKPTLSLLLFATLAGAALWLTGCGQSQTAQGQQLYTCGMHPQVIQNKPGNCPICGMKLTPIRKQARTDKSSAGPATVERKVNYYKSTMMPGEVRQTPGKDSMGMEMVPVYDDKVETRAAAQSNTIDPVTTQTMGIRTATVTRGPVRRVV